MARAVREAETKVMESMREVSGDAATALEVLRDVARETALKPGATFVEVARYAATVAETAADGDAEALATAAEFFERALALMPPTPRGVPELADDWRGFVDEDGEEVAAESWVATAVPALEDEDGQRHRMALACQWCAEFLLLRSPTPPKGPRSASGDWERAEALLRRAAALDPRNGVVAGSLAMLLHRRRADSTVVQRWYERALALMPRQPSVLVKFGNFLKTQGETEAAAAQYRRAIELDEDNAEALGSLAVLLHGTNGDYGAAETLYRRSVDANPFHTNNLGNLGLFLADVRKNYDEAEEMYRRALDTDPTHANTLYNVSDEKVGGRGEERGEREMGWRRKGRKRTEKDGKGGERRFERKSALGNARSTECCWRMCGTIRMVRRRCTGGRLMRIRCTRSRSTISLCCSRTCGRTSPRRRPTTDSRLRRIRVIRSCSATSGRSCGTRGKRWARRKRSSSEHSNSTPRTRPSRRKSSSSQRMWNEVARDCPTRWG